MLFSSLAECLIGLRTYGKQATDLKATANFFYKNLKHINPEYVINAFHGHILKSSQFPTPADIIDIIQDHDDTAYSLYQEVLTGKSSHEWAIDWSHPQEVNKMYDVFCHLLMTGTSVADLKDKINQMKLLSSSEKIKSFSKLLD